MRPIFVDRYFARNATFLVVMAKIGVAIVVAALGLPVLAKASLAAPGVAAKPPRCLRLSDVVLRKTREVVVYTNRDLRYYACYRPTGRRVRLDRPEYNGGLQVYGPAGRYLVTIASQSPRYEAGGEILTVGMFNVRTGAYYFIARHGYLAWSQAVDAVVLRPSGSVAWLTNTGRQTDEYRLEACQFPGCYSRYRRGVNARSLDRGQIPPDSVVLDGEILRWTNSGQQRSTVLP